MSDETYDRPRPDYEPEAVPYGDALREHRLTVQHCLECGEHFFPPSTRCPGCLSDRLEWLDVAGSGTVWASVTLHRAYQPAYEGDVPYNIAIVELDEGPKVWTNVVGVPPSEVVVGMRVAVRFDDVAEDLTLARFVPEAAG